MGLIMEERTPPPYRPKRRIAADISELRELNLDVELKAVSNPDIELSPGMKELLGLTLEGMRSGCDPKLAPSGASGAYLMSRYFDDGSRKNVSVFKPMDEEIGAVNNPREKQVCGCDFGGVVGQGAVREVASYLLDYPTSGYRSSFTDEIGFSGVPPTIMVECVHKEFPGLQKRKTGSLQKFMPNKGGCENFGTNKLKELHVQEVHKIAVLDIRLANADRHLDNLLLSEGEDKLIPIDHGLCIPENFDHCRFDWIDWVQCGQPFSSDTLDYIRRIDADHDIHYLQSYGLNLSPASQKTLQISSLILKKGAEAGLTASQIGNMFLRDIKEDVESPVQRLVSAASSDCFFKDLSTLIEQYFAGLGNSGF